MNFLATVLLVAVNSASGPGPGFDKAVGDEVCKDQQEAECKVAYVDAGNMCSRYYLRETEAYTLCHSSAHKRLEICMNKVEVQCAENPTDNMPKDHIISD